MSIEAWIALRGLICYMRSCDKQRLFFWLPLLKKYKDDNDNMDPPSNYITEDGKRLRYCLYYQQNWCDRDKEAYPIFGL